MPVFYSYAACMSSGFSILKYLKGKWTAFIKRFSTLTDPELYSVALLQFTHILHGVGIAAMSGAGQPIPSSIIIQQTAFAKNQHFCQTSIKLTRQAL